MTDRARATVRNAIDAARGSAQLEGHVELDPEIIAARRRAELGEISLEEMSSIVRRRTMELADVPVASGATG